MKLTRRQREVLEKMAAGNALYHKSLYYRLALADGAETVSYPTARALRRLGLVETERSCGEVVYYRLTEAGIAALGETK